MKEGVTLFDRQRLKIARKQKKLTQEELARLVNTTKGTISNYENGHSKPNDEMLVILANKLDCSTDYLLGVVDKPTSYTSKEEFVSVVRERGPDYSGLNEDEIEMFHKMIDTYIKNKKK